MWFAIAKYVAVIVASYLVNQALAPRPKNNTPEAATEESWQLPQPTEGTPQCVFFGDCWTDDWFVLGYGNYRYDAIKK
ncbi:hypothetical protein AB6V67_12485 [Serratia marcescens]|uniref:Tail assembly protein n=1 Tax=Serratia marcescens SM39 TaxID=1334564 RepID=A0AAT9EWR1_SERMA|nr:MULTISPECIES: hypothetical protein [Serratia]AYJ94922.1 hypothetical protein D9K64_18175 [Klebsiella pneumoniae]MCP1106686.1 hypothetical protein [Serratia nevei]EIV2911566.1 hypothetical protein [Serratia marcescens]MBH3263640.1 hypothetical protein [Serratia marcescens]MBI6154261.1 hypothetical protein [Serratia surfactantfaciens]